MSNNTATSSKFSVANDSSLENPNKGAKLRFQNPVTILDTKKLEEAKYHFSDPYYDREIKDVTSQQALLSLLHTTNKLSKDVDSKLKLNRDGYQLKYNVPIASNQFTQKSLSPKEVFEKMYKLKDVVGKIFAVQPFKLEGNQTADQLTKAILNLEKDAFELIRQNTDINQKYNSEDITSNSGEVYRSSDNKEIIFRALPKELSYEDPVGRELFKVMYNKTEEALYNMDNKFQQMAEIWGNDKEAAIIAINAVNKYKLSILDEKDLTEKKAEAMEDSFERNLRNEIEGIQLEYLQHMNETRDNFQGYVNTTLKEKDDTNNAMADATDDSYEKFISNLELDHQDQINYMETNFEFSTGLLEDELNRSKDQIQELSKALEDARRQGGDSAIQSEQLKQYIQESNDAAAQMVAKLGSDNELSKSEIKKLTAMLESYARQNNQQSVLTKEEIYKIQMPLLQDIKLIQNQLKSLPVGSNKDDINDLIHKRLEMLTENWKGKEREVNNNFSSGSLTGDISNSLNEIDSDMYQKVNNQNGSSASSEPPLPPNQNSNQIPSDNMDLDDEFEEDYEPDQQDAQNESEVQPQQGGDNNQLKQQLIEELRKLKQQMEMEQNQQQQEALARRYQELEDQLRKLEGQGQQTNPRIQQLEGQLNQLNQQGQGQGQGQPPPNNMYPASFMPITNNNNNNINPAAAAPSASGPVNIVNYPPSSGGGGGGCHCHCSGGSQQAGSGQQSASPNINIIGYQ